MGRWRWAAVVAAVVVLAGCSGGGGEPEEPPATTPAAVSSEPTEPEPEPAGLAAEWIPQLEAAQAEHSTNGVCAEASSVSCAEYLVVIMEVVLGITEALPSEEEYPSTVSLIDSMIGAFNAYSDAGCVEVEAEACGVESLIILIGAQRLGEAMETDDARL